MSNFVNRIAIRVSDKVFTKSMIDGLWIRTALERMGYHIGDLRFYPDKPYLCTFYKSTAGRLGTTNTPFKEGRTVIEEWNKDLFFALCCQREGSTVEPGEYYTENKTGSIYQCSDLYKEWIRTDLPGGGNVVFKAPQVHKSTVEELIEFFAGKSVPEDEPDEPLVKLKQSVKDKIASGVVAHQIAKTQNGHRLDSPTVIEEVQVASGLVDLPSIEIQVNSEVKLESEIRLPGPLTFKEVLHWFGEGNDICVGKIENGEIHCKTYAIESVSKHAVQLVDQKAMAHFDNIFRNTEEFLRYALQKVS